MELFFLILLGWRMVLELALPSSDPECQLSQLEGLEERDSSLGRW